MKTGKRKPVYFVMISIRGVYNYVLLLLAVILPLIAFPQKYHLTYYAAPQGLQSNEIRHVTHDQYGYLWLATDDGLVRVDGYECQTFS